jgi:Tfp pilus assembly protein PilX
MRLLQRACSRATATRAATPRTAATATSTRAAAGRSWAAAEEGFTLMIALGVMFVTSLMLVAAFAAANGDINLTHDDATQKQAYYAALAGVQEYEYHLQSNPDYWETCAQPSNTVPNEASEHYAIKLLTASTAPKGTTECSKANPFGTMIQAGGSEANTFRIESTGTAGTEGKSGFEKRHIVATFRVVGFLNYAYFTQYETEDPILYEGPKFCGENYRPKREELEKKFHEECQSITFYSEDSVKGPVHTDDEAEVCSGSGSEQVSFGREGHSPPDPVEFNYGYKNVCGGKPKFNTTTGNYTVGTELLPPEGDTSLATYVKEGGEGGDEF